ncbi:MAG: serine hydrolase [Saprospiraceae bacterium]
MKTSLPILGIVLLIGCAGHKHISKKEDPETARLDSLLTPYILKLRELTDNTAGLAIGVSRGDKTVYTKTFGFVQVAQKEKVDVHTGFHLASLSKPFSAVAIARLIQDKKLKLDDPIVKHIPEFSMLGEGYDKITIEHILTHTSGIPRNLAPDDWTKPSFGPNALAENLDIAKQVKLDFEPGTKFSYSNSAFDILGVVISRASGMPFHEYLEKMILKPAGMLHTSCKKSMDAFPRNWATAHSYGIYTQAWKPFPYNERLFPSSGVVSSISDMCLWGQFHLGKGTVAGRQILDEEHYNLLVSPKYNTPWGDKVGLSWFLQSYLDRPIIMHTGFDTGFEAMMYIYPEEQISIVVLANRDFSRTGRLVNAVSEIIFGQQPKAYNVSAKYKFAEVYKSAGISAAKASWQELKKDTMDIYFVEDEDMLTTGAILENGGSWKEAKEVLNYYLTMDEESTYAWRLLGNVHLGLGDTLNAISCYQQTLKINPEYEKGRQALEKLTTGSGKH